MKTVEKETKTILHTSDDGAHTFSVTKLLDGKLDGHRHMILVGLYPTRTEENSSVDDDTMRHLLSHLPELGFDSLSVINLFSKVVKNCRMSTRGIEVDRMNLDYIRGTYIENESFSDSTWVIAWGATGGTSKAVNASKIELLEIWGKKFPKRKIFQLNALGVELKEGDPVHPLFLGIRAGSAKWSLESFDWRKCVKALKEEQERKAEQKARKTGDKKQVK